LIILAIMVLVVFRVLIDRPTRLWRGAGGKTAGT